MSDNDNPNALAFGTGTASPSDSDSATLDQYDFEEQDQPANPEPEQAENASDDEPVEGESQETEDQDDEGLAEQEASEPSVADDKATVKLSNGEVISVEEARNGYMRQSDYSVKTSQIAEQRRALEANANHITRATENIAAFLQQNMPPAPDPNLLYSDPQEHYRQKAVHEAALGQIQHIISMGEGPRQAVSQLTEAQQRETLQVENAKLAERFPETTRSDTRQKFFEGAFQTARELGFTDRDIADVTDHRIFATMHYARLGMAAEKAKATAARKVENKPPVVAPVRQNVKGNPQGRDYQAAKNRFAQTGSLDDAIALLPD